MQKRGHNLEPNDYIFCHEDGEPIEYVRGFDIMLKDAGMTYDSQGKKRTIYSLRHTYATLENGSAKVCHGSGRIVLLRAE
jgi:site-specific recombinase XerD